MIVAGTGHRPPKLGGYSQEAFNHVARVAGRALEEFRPSVVISGMALGWDTALALAAYHHSIELWAYIPGEWQPNKWPQSSRDLWADLRGHASKVVDASHGGPYNVEALQVRNMLMVDDCDQLLALWDGSSGGTASCIAYAKEVGRPTINLWEDFLK